MKSVNWYTALLGSFGILSFVYSILHLHAHQLDLFLILLFIIIILEIFPIKLPSGDDFEAGSIGFLFVLLQIGFGHAVLALALGLIVAFMKTYRSVRIPWFRVVVNIGMYSFALLTAFYVWNLTKEMNIILSVALATFAYEFVNLLLLELILKITFKRELFSNFTQQLKELIVPISVYSIVIPTLLIQETTKETIITMLYTVFFLLIVIFFSSEYTKQLSLRKSSSRAFIQVLEGSITPNLAGHGNRVGIICDTLLDDLGFPKRKRNDLIQAAYIHDIGKALLPSHIFRKRGDLTLSEEREYKSHPQKAVEIVRTMFPKEEFSNWILYHHERWDGKGFPKGIKGEEIPIGARIIALANEIDHILSRHDDPETISRLLKERAGTVLDPALVEKIELHHIESMLEELNFTQEGLLVSGQDSVINDSYSNIGESFFIQVDNGRIISANKEIPTPFLQKLVHTAIERQEPVHETYRQQQLIYDVHAQSLKQGEVTLFAHNLTPQLLFRERLERNILESYVEVIDTLSEGKFKLYTSNSTMEEQLGERLEGLPIHNTSDVSKCRELTAEALKQYPSKLQAMKVQVAVSEAVTNVLKHATKGNFSIFKGEQMLQFLISDKGSGIPLHEIPKTILVSGYSSKRSLGKGFKIIGSFSDEVHIFTSTEGTSILLKFNLLQGE